MLTSLRCSMNDLKVREHLINKMQVNEQQIHDAMDLAEIHEETQHFEDYLVKLGIIDSKQHEEVSPYRNIGAVVGDYTIDDVVGTGAMDIVYLAHKGDSSEQVALKVINGRHCEEGDFIARFHREADAVSKLEHQHIIKAIDKGNIGEDMYLATEYINGPSLSEILESFGPLPELYVLQCMKQVADGLRYAYETSNLVHRDLKPANILVDHGLHSSKQHLKPMTDNDIVKIIDFGLTKQVDDDQHLTVTGFAMGTPYYMSPEQIRGESDVDSYMDIYSFGATMYRLITGEYPYKGKSAGAVMLAHIMEDIPNPADLIPSLKPETVAIIMTCMAKEPEDRFQNYDALELAIEKALNACRAQTTTMSVLRKPLVIKHSARIKKSSNESTTGQSNSDDQEAATSDVQQCKPISNSSIERARQARQHVQDPVQQVIEQESGDRSSTLLQTIIKQLNEKKSAAFEDGIEREAISDKAVWVALAASVLFMVSGIASRLFILT